MSRVIDWAFVGNDLVLTLRLIEERCHRYHRLPMTIFSSIALATGGFGARPSLHSASIRKDSMASNGILRITEQDHRRLRRLLNDLIHESRETMPALGALEEILGLARIVHPEKVPCDVVTMNSRVLYQDIATQMTHAVTVVYPAEADPSSGKISVLSPVGVALIGESEGDELELPAPHGRTPRIRIIEVIYQPESQGHFAL